MLGNTKMESYIESYNNLLFVPTNDSQSYNSVLSRQFTLRCCSRDYRNETGKFKGNTPPELDSCKQAGKIAPLTTFDNYYGHCYQGRTTIFPSMHHDGISSWVSYISSFMHRSVSRGNAWDLHDTVSVNINEHPSRVTEQALKCMQIQNNMDYIPISAYTPQAFVESFTKRGKAQEVFQVPSTSTFMTGILGGLHNNGALEMGFDEPEGTKDIPKRTYNKNYLGFICAGHNSHSEDAGKSRRVCAFTRIRVGSKTPLYPLENLEVSNTGEWIVYCMGSTFNTDLDGIFLIVMMLKRASMRYKSMQFEVRDYSHIPVPPTYMVYYKERILSISIAPGIIVRTLPDNTMVDSMMLYRQPKNPIIKHASLPTHGPESIQYMYSAWFMLAPWVEDDRPPRTLLSSVQTTQAVCLPWSPATARISPLHVSLPLISTDFVRQIERDQEDNPGAMWDVMPGEDMVVCYMNHPLNYDDSMIVSSKFSDMGGFSTISVCTYRIPQDEERPEIGEQLCRKKYRWWKVNCTSSCVCKRPPRLRNKKILSTDGRIPSGTVLESNLAENGELQIRIQSYAQLITGDKVSTLHGQKGIARIVPQHELPIIVMPDGSSFTADIYMAVGSIVSRQTNGQFYESGAAARVAKDGRKGAVYTDESIDTDDCSYIMHASTGTKILREIPGSRIEPIRATVGMTRVLNQTQTTRERHHLTHSSEGKYSLSTTSGRASGGGVAAAEMDFHAMYSSGLIGCAQEILERGNNIRTLFCTKCERLAKLCECDIPGKFVRIRISSDMTIFDEISLCTNGSANTYKIRHV